MPIKSKRIDKEFIELFNNKFTEEVAQNFRQQHAENCHHWDYTFLLWHRKFITNFWQTVDLPITYAVLTEQADRILYASLKKTIWQVNGRFVFLDDPNKLNSFTSQDLAAMRLNIAEAMACSSFAIDLKEHPDPRIDRNRGRGIDYAYNLSFSSQVEEFHDIIHGETSRSMRDVVTAGGDQCFFVHHSFVDLIFETWLNDNPSIGLPISEEHYNSTDDLKKDYGSYQELVDLWKARYFTEDDYKVVRRISEPIVRQVVVFDRIEHTEDYRRVIMYHDGEEIGRFAILTGRVETCLSCARRGHHSGQFLLTKLVPVSEIGWRINNHYHPWEDAVHEFAKIGMSRPQIVSF